MSAPTRLVHMECIWGASNESHVVTCVMDYSNYLPLIVPNNRALASRIMTIFSSALWLHKKQRIVDRLVLIGPLDRLPALRLVIE